MSEARWLVGDVFARLADIADATVDLVATSPPFWRQRAYLPADHPDKAREIGQEATPGQFIDTLLRLTAELGRVLAPHGSIAVELADTSAGSGGAGGDYNPGGFRDGQPKWNGSAKRAGRPAEMTTRAKQARVDNGTGHQAIPDLHGKKQPHPGADGPAAKSLCMIPEAYRLALAYGRHPLTGERSPTGRWIVRNVVDWCRPNPTPGDDGDKFRRASSDIVIATRDPRRWWDGEALREPATGNPGVGTGQRKGQGVDNGDHRPDTMPYRASDGTRPLYDWWAITPAQYPGAHYAVWTAEIARRLILPMCPERVCRQCGEPSRRIVERAPSPYNGENGTGAARDRYRLGVGVTGSRHEEAPRTARTVGWTDCGHDDWRRGVVLDPFAGSGTTLAVATGLGRDAIGIDLDDRNFDLARDRIGMFLEVSG